jgi:sulfate transport system ATP-binding protein
MSIHIENVSRQFGDYAALQDINLEIRTGELVALLGPSGSGKTTLLRIIAGLERSDTGRILLHGSDATEIPVRSRRVGFVFQHYALFRHMTVFKNIAFGLSVLPRRDRPSRELVRKRVLELLHLMQLNGLENRFPSQLSGGQRQRVALARALAIDPKVLLLDEPFGALDAKVRKELRRWLRHLLDQLHITTVFVTHDQDEALEVADRVVVMRQARIEQVGTPEEIYDRPATPFVHEFLGETNALRNVNCALGELAGGRQPTPQSTDDLVAYVRPHNVHIARQRNGVPSMEATVRHVHAAGPVARLELELKGSGDSLDAQIPRSRYSELAVKVGDTVYASVNGARVFPGK